MTRNTHDLVNDHFGDLDDAQIAGGSAASGQVPVSNGDGTRTWTDQSGGGGGAEDFLTGNDVDFAASLGNWVTSALGSDPTLTRDTSYKITNLNASAKAVFSANADKFIEVPITGTFTSGEDYWGIVFVSLEDTSGGTRTIYLDLGVPGTDWGRLTWTPAPATGKAFVGSTNWICIGVRFRPSADRSSGLKLRLTNHAAIATTLHVGLARAVGVGRYGSMPLTPDPGNSGRVIAPYLTSDVLGANTQPVYSGPTNDYVEISGPDGSAYIDLYGSGGNVEVYSDSDFYLEPSGHIDMRNAGGLMFPPKHTSDPTGVTGGVYYNTSTNKLRVYNGSAWQDCN